MKRRILLITAMLLLTLSLAGCGNQVYRDFNSKLVSLSKDNCFEKVSETQLLKILDTAETNGINNELTYVFYASPSDSDSPTVLEVIMQQTEQYSVEKVYYISSDKYDTAEERDVIEEKLQFNDAANIPSLLCYLDGKIEFDGSKASVRNKYSGSYASMSRYLFIDLPASLV